MIIELTDQEAEICKVLDEVARNYKAKEGKTVQLRIAGGWVRDKVSLCPNESLKVRSCHRSNKVANILYRF